MIGSACGYYLVKKKYASDIRRCRMVNTGDCLLLSTRDGPGADGIVSVQCQRSLRPASKLAFSDVAYKEGSQLLALVRLPALAFSDCI